MGLLALCAALKVKATDAVPPCNELGAASGNAYSMSIEYSESIAACVVLTSKLVTGVPATIAVSTPAIVLYVVPLIIAVAPFTDTLNCNPVSMPVNKLGVPPVIAASTASHAPEVPVYFTLYEHFVSAAEPEPNPADESPGIMVATAQFTVVGVPAPTETVPAANVSVLPVLVPPKIAFVAPTETTPRAANALNTASVVTTDFFHVDFHWISFVFLDPSIHSVSIRAMLAKIKASAKLASNRPPSIANMM